jgi:hypothetical protein
MTRSCNLAGREFQRHDHAKIEGVMLKCKPAYSWESAVL